jgi:hypothetical protein
MLILQIADDGGNKQTGQAVTDINDFLRVSFHFDCPQAFASRERCNLIVLKPSRRAKGAILFIFCFRISRKLQFCRFSAFASCERYNLVEVRLSHTANSTKQLNLSLPHLGMMQSCCFVVFRIWE